MSFNDFVKMFYMATICYFRDDYMDTTICDQHRLGGFGLFKFNYNPVSASRNSPITFTIDQANWRFYDKTNDGHGFSAATMYLIVTRLETQELPDGTKRVIQKKIGEKNTSEEENTCLLTIAFDHGLPGGDYVVMYSADW
jgi:hypothetical protein